jgi:hypothetical protein
METSNDQFTSITCNVSNHEHIAGRRRNAHRRDRAAAHLIDKLDRYVGRGPHLGFIAA